MTVWFPRFVLSVALMFSASGAYSASQYKVQFGGSTGFKLIQVTPTFISIEGSWLAFSGCNYGVGLAFISYPDVATRNLFMTQLTFAMASGKKFLLVGTCVNHNPSTSRIDATEIITLVESASP